MQEIYPTNFEPSMSHKFIQLLEEKGKLLRNYTQNIDTLENKAGISRVVQCHGSFATASCINCKFQVAGKSIETDIFNMQVPRCKKCKNPEFGIIKPDIVFFGEDLPKEFHLRFNEDREKVDLLIVMGSSLKVAPVANVKDKIPATVPQILINMESLAHMENFDIHLLGYSDEITKKIIERLGWDDSNKANQSSSTPIPSINSHGQDNEYPQPGHLPWVWYFDGALSKPLQFPKSDTESEHKSDDSSLQGDYEPPESPVEESGDEDSKLIDHHIQDEDSNHNATENDGHKDV
jgi:NAD-dependent SIR2 family protein deacetylase